MDSHDGRDRVGALAELAEARAFRTGRRARCYAGWVAVEERHVEEGVGRIASGLASLREAGVAL
jgi:hypothetical protein